MIDWYVPNICAKPKHFGNKRVVSITKPSFEKLDGLKEAVYISDNLTIDDKYKLLASGIRIKPTTQGINLDKEFLKLKNVMKSEYFTKENAFIHFQYDDWNFYYPRSYEELILIRLKDEFEFYSMNEYIIKNIIE